MFFKFQITNMGMESPEKNPDIVQDVFQEADVEILWVSILRWGENWEEI